VATLLQSCAAYCFFSWILEFKLYYFIFVHWLPLHYQQILPLIPQCWLTNVIPLPTNFTMIADDTCQRNFTYLVPYMPKSFWDVALYNIQPFLHQAALGFNCLDYSKPPKSSPYRHFLPDKAYFDANCTDGVRFELMFPSYWNGSLDSLDHKSHVAYPSEVMTGNCLQINSNVWCLSPSKLSGIRTSFLA
jgi:hypothetical protein